MFANKFEKYEGVECGLIQMVKGQSHQNKIPIPLQSVTIVASVIHPVAQVELTQIYVNKEEQPIEAIYYFPVDSNGRVTNFEAELEGRKLQAVLKPEDEAKKQYDKAISRKQTAIFVESNKPDIFKVCVGYLKPGSQVKIVIGYVTEVKNEAKKGSNALRFFIPTTVAPRYISPNEVDEAAKDLRNMIFFKSTPAPLQITVNVAIQGEIKSIESPTHKIIMEILKHSLPGKEKWRRAIVTLEGNTTDMDRDFVLLINPSQIHVPRVYSEKSKNSTAFMAHLIPSFELGQGQKIELIFVLDRSGSMLGSSINLAKMALALFLHSLPLDCYFNIVGFGSTFQFLYPESVKYGNESLKNALTHAQNLNADLGGTEILGPLQAIYNQNCIPGYLRQIFLLTDGAVSCTEQVISLCQANAHKSRVFCLGIGSAASHHLVEGIASAGGGTAAFVANNESMNSKILQQLKNSIQPSLTEVKITWTGIPKPHINQSKTLVGYGKPIDEIPPYLEVPKKIPPIFDSSQLVVFGVFPYGFEPSGVEIQAESPDGPLSLQMEISPENELGEGGNSDLPGMIHKLAAVKAIQELEMKEAGMTTIFQDSALKEEIIRIALTNGLVSRYTSFVAVDEDTNADAAENEGWIMQTRLVPSQIAADWGGYLSSDLSSYFDVLDIPGPRSSSRSTRARVYKEKLEDDDEMGFGLFDDDSTSTSFSAVTPGEELLHNLISNQYFNGSFPLTKQFSMAIEIPLEILMEKNKSSNIAPDILATVLGLIYMDGKLQEIKDCWELAYSKGRNWLEMKCGSIEAATLVLESILEFFKRFKANTTSLGE